MGSADTSATVPQRMLERRLRGYWAMGYTIGGDIVPEGQAQATLPLDWGPARQTGGEEPR